MATDKIIFAVGNEAGDLDSIVSSIGIAWLYNALDTTDATRVVPLIPFPRSEFRLRRDVVYLFHLVGFHLNQHWDDPGRDSPNSRVLGRALTSKVPSLLPKSLLPQVRPLGPAARQACEPRGNQQGPDSLGNLRKIIRLTGSSC